MLHLFILLHMLHLFIMFVYVHYDSLCFTPVKHRDCLVAVPCQTRFARLTETSGASLAGVGTKQSGVCLVPILSEPQ